jgi:hypothetical protein
MYDYSPPQFYGTSVVWTCANSGIRPCILRSQSCDSAGLEVGLIVKSEAAPKEEYDL